MKLTINHRNLPLGSSLDSLVENRLVALSERLEIDDATVVIERRAEASPPYRVHLHLSVPGPDLHTEQVDTTPVQALARAMKDIELKLCARARNRQGRLKARRTSGSRGGFARSY
jgi:ribosome-associated translation inhibitor RaiA